MRPFVRWLLPAVVLFVAQLPAALSAQENAAAGPLAVGSNYVGTFKSGRRNKKGVLVEPVTHQFRLRIDTVDGEKFTGLWTWSEKESTEVAGTVNKNGLMDLKFVRNVKGKSPAAFDGRASGKVTDSTLSLRYARPSGGRIGIAEAERHQPADFTPTPPPASK